MAFNIFFLRKNQQRRKRKSKTLQHVTVSGSWGECFPQREGYSKATLQSLYIHHFRQSIWYNLFPLHSSKNLQDTLPVRLQKKCNAQHLESMIMNFLTKGQKNEYVSGECCEFGFKPMLIFSVLLLTSFYIHDYFQFN